MQEGLFLRRIFLEHNNEHAAEDEDKGGDADYQPKQVKGALSFRNVDFAYQPEKQVLKDFNLEVQAGQKVVSTGLYGVVRHPMYAATLLLFLSMPLVLASGMAFVIFLAYPAIIVKRIRGEEALLARELEGYSEYMQKVRYRLIPFVW